MLMLSASLFAALSDPHPTLPTAWTATVKEVEVGVVFESYIMVDKPTPTNPSGKWTNYTDGSCQRLIYDGDIPSARRYLLGCDALDCCYEEQSGNHVEYQIPNVHPGFLAPVTHKGKETVNLFNSTSISADAYQWKFAIEKFTAYTVGSTLVRWNVNANGVNFTNDYANYTAVPESELAAFQATFNVPAQCQGSQIFKCDGQVSDKSLKFLRAGRMRPAPNHHVVEERSAGKKPFAIGKTSLDTCTGPHESCCEAPGDDPNNCPASARTSDCDAKKSCCCG